MRFRRDAPVRPTIPSVAMADLAFLLLVFFACTTVLRRDQHESPPLPRAADSETIEEEPAARLLVDATGTLHSGAHRIVLDELPEFLGARVGAGPNRAVLLEVDRQLRCDVVAPILESLRATGVRTVCFAVQPMPPSR